MRGTIQNRATELKVIPTLNSIISKVFTILSDRNSSFSDLSDVVKHDQAISSKVISIANSAYYSRGIEICSLQRAMINIGFEEAKSIIMSILFMENMLKQLKLREEDLFALWNHSIYVACASKVLSEKLLVEDPQKVYTAGLLHDIGKVLFYMDVEDYGAMLKQAHAAGKSIIQMEDDNFGIDHQSAGYSIAVKWKFPPEFTQVIRYHHEGETAGRHGPLVHLVGVADRFSTDPHTVPDREGFILTKEKDSIASEMRNIMDLLRMA
jgi:putative nucleotidyltransferase with HDIG domain